MDHCQLTVRPPFGPPSSFAVSTPIHPGSQIASACTVSSLGQSPHHPLIQTLSIGSRTEGQTLMQGRVHSNQELAAVLPGTIRLRKRGPIAMEDLHPFLRQRHQVRIDNSLPLPMHSDDEQLRTTTDETSVLIAPLDVLRILRRQSADLCGAQFHGITFSMDLRTSRS